MQIESLHIIWIVVFVAVGIGIGTLLGFYLSRRANTSRAQYLESWEHELKRKRIELHRIAYQESTSKIHHQEGEPDQLSVEQEELWKRREEELNVFRQEVEIEMSFLREENQALAEELKSYRESPQISGGPVEPGLFEDIIEVFEEEETEADEVKKDSHNDVLPKNVGEIEEIVQLDEPAELDAPVRLEDDVSGDAVSDDTVSDDTVSGNAVSGDAALEDSGLADSAVLESAASDVAKESEDAPLEEVEETDTGEKVEYIHSSASFEFNWMDEEPAETLDREQLAEPAEPIVGEQPAESTQNTADEQPAEIVLDEQPAMPTQNTLDEEPTHFDENDEFDDLGDSEYFPLGIGSELPVFQSMSDFIPFEPFDSFSSEQPQNPAPSQQSIQQNRENVRLVGEIVQLSPDQCELLSDLGFSTPAKLANLSANEVVRLSEIFRVSPHTIEHAWIRRAREILGQL